MKAYFRRSIADQLLLSPSDDEIDQGLFFSLDQIRNGRFETSFLSSIPDDFDHVWVAPVLCNLLPDHGFLPDGLPRWISPLWFSARLDRYTGSISFATHRTPWIARENLSPSKSNSLIFGSLESWENYTKEKTFVSSDSVKNWSEGLKWMTECLVHVTGHSLEGFEWSGYGRFDKGVVVKAPAHENQMSSLLRVASLSLLLKNDKKTVLNRISSRDTPIVAQSSKNCKWPGLRSHLAHVDGLPLLNNDQKNGLYSLLNQTDKKVHIVHAPDGTGKSLLLLQWLANRWTRSTLESTHKEPILVIGKRESKQHLKEMVDVKNPLKRWGFPYLGWFYQKNTTITMEEQKVGLEKYLESARTYFKSESIQLDEIIQLIKEEIETLSGDLQEFPQLMMFKEEIEDKKRQLIYTCQISASEFDHFVCEQRKTLEQRKQAWRIFSHLNGEWGKHLANTPMWMEWTGGLPLTKQKNTERNKLFFSRFRITPKNIIWDDNENITRMLSQMVVDVGKLMQESQKTVDKIRSIEDGFSKWNHLKEKYLAKDKQHGLSLDGDEDLSIAVDASNTLKRTSLLKWVARHQEGLWLRASIQEKVMAPEALFPAVFWSIEEEPPELIGRVIHDTVWIHDMDRIPSIYASVMSGLSHSLVLAGETLLPSPLLDLPESIDCDNAIQSRLIQETKEWGVFKRSNASVASGSFLKSIEKVSIFNQMLNTDYIHHPGLVFVLSQIMYHGRLKSPENDMRKVWNTHAFRWAHIPDNGDPHRIPLFLSDWLTENSDVCGCNPEDVAFLTVSDGMIEKLENILARTPFSTSECLNVFNPTPRNKKKLALFIAESNVMDSGFSVLEQNPALWIRILGHATDALWVMGDLNGWSSLHNSPLGIVSHALFMATEAELPSANLPAWSHRKDLSPESFNISDWDEFWSQWSGNENSTLVIVSPTITPEGVECVKFFSFIKRMVKDRVSVVLYANKFLCEKYDEHYLREFAEACDSYGVTLIWKNAMHDSMMWMDDSLVEFSSSPLSSGGTLRAMYMQGDTRDWREQRIFSWDSPLF